MESLGRDFTSRYNQRYNTVSKRILRMLSEDSRASLTSMSKELNVSRRSIATRIKRLEGELDINYVPELNEDALGFSNQHLIAVKFEDKPDFDEIGKLLSASRVPQMVAQVRGTFDMLIYANAPSRQEYVRWDKGTQVALADYNVMWHPSEIAHRQLGFFPIRNKLIEAANLKPKYKNLLLHLNRNARASFQEISKETDMHFNTVSYEFWKLMKMNYVKRFTIAMSIPKDVAVMVHFGKYVLPKTFEQDMQKTRREYKADEDNPLISRYILCSQLIGSYDFAAMGVFDDYNTAYKRQVKYYKEVLKPERARVEYGQIERILFGRLPIRTVNTAKEYDTVVWDEKAASGEA